MKKKTKKKNNKITTNQYINVADIKNNLLYTKDNNILAFIKLGTVAISTMNKTDINLLTKALCSEFASLKVNLRMFKISKPVDMSKIVNNYRDMYRNSRNLKQKELLREATLYLHKYSTNGNELENEYYFIVSKEISNNSALDLEKMTKDICRKFQAGKIHASICNTEEIARLCNLFSNPSYGNIEAMELENSISLINNLELYEVE
ncbi:hypothetical protein [uncultured Tyzzerella sp.]|uniref:hypothetical protein n=1 Tax=uncultured Tyzzerella sp. TaxID=2321398 RepID=UPI00294365F9|nr:hypothetical protein [uncultured Tyzzerella sp.]